MPMIYEGNLRQSHVITMLKNIMYVSLKNKERSYIMVLLVELSQHSQSSYNTIRKQNHSRNNERDKIIQYFSNC